MKWKAKPFDSIMTRNETWVCYYTLAVSYPVFIGHPFSEDDYDTCILGPEQNLIDQFDIERDNHKCYCML